MRISGGVNDLKMYVSFDEMFLMHGRYHFFLGTCFLKFFVLADDLADFMYNSGFVSSADEW